MRIRVLMTVLCGVLLLAACGGDNKVGDDSLLNFKDQAQQRLGATTTTAAVATTVAPGAKGQLGLGAATTAPPQKAVVTTQPPQQAPAFEIDINGDGTASTQFDPAAARVFRGSTVRWVNKDTQPRSVEADTGAFKSGPIPPGGSWTYQAGTVGTFNYHDGTRPYAVGSFEVVNR
jgi:plastocyanin